jgi:hypothetical protein
MTKEEKQYFIYIRSTGEKVPVTKEQHDSFYREASRIRDKEQNHGRCMCPYRFIWKCDGDCIGCEYHAAGDTLLWISLSRTATVPSAIISRIPEAYGRGHRRPPCCWSSSLPVCVNLIRRPIPSFSFGRITRKASPTVPSPESSVARRRPSLIR